MNDKRCLPGPRRMVHIVQCFVIQEKDNIPPNLQVKGQSVVYAFAIHLTTRQIQIEPRRGSLAMHNIGQNH